MHAKIVKSHVSGFSRGSFYIVTAETIVLSRDDKLLFPSEIYKYPLYINVQFHACPQGFALTNTKCECMSFLKEKMATVKCDIQSQTVSRDGSDWVGDYGDTVAGSQYCPFNYCKSERVQLGLEAADTSNGTDSQ